MRHYNGTHNGPLEGLFIPGRNGNPLMLDHGNDTLIIPVYTTQTMLHKEMRRLKIPSDYGVMTISDGREFVNNIPTKLDGKTVAIVKDLHREGGGLIGSELLRN